MPLFGKGKAAKYDYYLLVHSLSPFPANYRSLYIAWQRGSGNRGQTRSVGPTIEGSTKAWATYQFDEPLHVACTLNQDQKGQGSNPGGGLYEKKWLILAIMDGDANARSKEPLGRVVINLSDYAAEDDKATMSFTVAASKAIVTDVGECKMLITLGCRSKGKPAMSLGGRPIARAVSNDRVSVASSEHSDDDEEEDGIPRIASLSQPAARIPSRSPDPAALPVRSRRYNQPAAESEEPARKQEPWRMASASKPAPKAAPARQPDSDEDSEDEFLAQAVAAMEGKAPMPSARPARQSSRAAVSRAPISSSGLSLPSTSASATSAKALQPQGVPATPFDPNLRVTSGFKPLFALKPEGQAAAEDEPPPTPKPLQAIQSDPTTRIDGAVFRHNSLESDSSEGRAAKKAANALAKYEPGQIPPFRRQSSKRDRAQAKAAAAAAAAVPLSVPRAADVSVSDRNQGGRNQKGADVGEEGADDQAFPGFHDRPQRGKSGRQLASEKPERAPSEAPDSPRRRNVEASRQQPKTEQTAEGKGVVLPTGSVSIRKRPIVSAPADETPYSDAHSPVKASGPGRHWLDEPEDLGVEASPASSPEATPRPAYQAVAPAPMSKVREASISADSTSRRSQVEDQRDPFADPEDSPASPRSPDSPFGDPATNPFMPNPPPVLAAPEREGFRDLLSTGLTSRSPSPVKERYPPELSTPRAAPAAAARQMPSPIAEVPPPNGNAFTGGATSPGVANGVDSELMEAYTRELRAIAALEASVYLAQSGKSRGVRASSKARNVHAPARRLARTTISLGPEEGVIFGRRAIRAIEAAADGAGDIAVRAYWWSNCIQLRWMLWAMCHGGGSEDGDADPDSDEFQWVMEELVPPLRELESHIFQQLFQHLWSNNLMEGVTADQLPGAQAKHWNISPSTEEEAVQRWIDGFQTAHRALLPAAKLVTAGHVALLKNKLLTALMQRLDATLFQHLATGNETPGSLRRDFFSSGSWKTGTGADIDLPLDKRTMPFAPGDDLTFSVGVNLKMAATRWTIWAADIGLRHDKGSPEEGYLLFPKLRATADLLMMPKEVLTDRAIRSEVVPGLPLRLICQLLSRFQPDELATDPLPPGLLEALQNETPPAAGQESLAPTSCEMASYEPPSEAALLAEGLIEPVSLEMDDESEDELEALVEMYDPDRQGHTTERFTLLRDLWASAR